MAGVKDPLLLDDIHRMIDAIEPVPGEASHDEANLFFRDRALLLVGFAGGFGRAELAALRVKDVRFKRMGMEIAVASKKAKLIKSFGHYHDERYCWVRTLKQYVKKMRLNPKGPLFCSHSSRNYRKPITGTTVRNVVIRAAEKAKLKGNYSAHSLRSGYIAEALAGGADIRSIEKHLGYKSGAMILRQLEAKKGVLTSPTDALGKKQ